jgi:hypothetical protein
MQGRMIGDRPVKINFGKETSGGLFDAPAQGTAAPATSEPQVEPPPPLVPEPTDKEQKQVIDKLCVFVERNGTRFADLTRERQKDNPKFAFLDPEHPLHGYYLLKLWCTRYPGMDPEQVRAKFAAKESASPTTPPPSSSSTSPPHRSSYRESSHQSQSYSAVPPPPSLMPSSSQQQQQQPRTTTALEQSDEMAKLRELLDNLVPTKDSIKVTKNYIMSQENRLREISAYMRNRIESAADFHTKLNIIYVINDILHHSIRERGPNNEQDAYSRAFEPHLFAMFSSCYRNEPIENQEKLMKVNKQQQQQQQKKKKKKSFLVFERLD